MNDLHPQGSGGVKVLPLLTVVRIMASTQGWEVHPGKVFVQVSTSEIFLDHFIHHRPKEAVLLSGPQSPLMGDLRERSASEQLQEVLSRLKQHVGLRFGQFLAALCLHLVHETL
jgi:hypothetical protein